MAFCRTKFRSLRILWTLLLSVAEGLRDAGTPAVPRVIDGPSVSQSLTQGRGEESKLSPLDNLWGE